MTVTHDTCRACGTVITRGPHSTRFVTIPGLGEFHGYCAPNKWAVEKILMLQHANDELTEALIEVREKQQMAREKHLMERDA